MHGISEIVIQFWQRLSNFLYYLHNWRNAHKSPRDQDVTVPSLFYDVYCLHPLYLQAGLYIFMFCARNWAWCQKTDLVSRWHMYIATELYIVICGPDRYILSIGHT